MKTIFLALVAFLIFGSAVIAPKPAQAGMEGVLEFLFPSLRKPEYDPTETLQAPFADPDAQVLKPLAQGQLPENSVPLNLPHRVDSAIGEWVVMAISESLTFMEDDFSRDLVKTKAYFAPEGRRQYAEFLKNKSILKVLQSKKYFIRNFVEDMPFTLNKGPIEGSYRWLFEVPIMLSYMERGMKNYRESEPVSQKITLTIQVGRVADAQNESGILIERWDGRLEKINKK